MYNPFIILLFSLIYSQYSYELEDINTTSSTYTQTISPSMYNNQVTLHYFGHQN